MNKGYALHYLEKYNEAIESYDKSLDIEPSKEAYVFKAYTEEELGNHNEAIECYEEAIKLDLNYDIAYNRKGQLLYLMNDFEAARDACMKALSISSEYADAYFNLSMIYMKLGEFNTAMSSLKMAIAIDEQFKEHALDEDIFNGYLETIL